MIVLCLRGTINSCTKDGKGDVASTGSERLKRRGRSSQPILPLRFTLYAVYPLPGNAVPYHRQPSTRKHRRHVPNTVIATCAEPRGLARRRRSLAGLMSLNLKLLRGVIVHRWQAGDAPSGSITNGSSNTQGSCCGKSALHMRSHRLASTEALRCVCTTRPTNM